MDKEEGYSVGYLIGLLAMQMGFLSEIYWVEFLFYKKDFLGNVCWGFDGLELEKLLDLVLRDKLIFCSLSQKSSEY